MVRKAAQGYCGSPKQKSFDTAQLSAHSEGKVNSHQLYSLADQRDTILPGIIDASFVGDREPTEWTGSLTGSGPWFIHGTLKVS